ncbi:MAG: carboxypeptidase regulatory-like domain-containing protein [Spirochaetes bacterium]|nr:carboxypeptidase regulatory-like domain-containing protein [Spirochaetota bacterium]
MKKIHGVASLLLIFAAVLSCANISRDVLTDGRAVFSGNGGELPRSEALEGSVLDSKTGKGVPGAIVELKNANLGVGYFRTVTDSRGRYRIADFLKNISYSATVVADGYVVHSERADIIPPSYNVNLDREAILAGEVKDSSGRPIEGVEVRLDEGFGGEYAPSGERRTATTGSDGRYRFNRLRDRALAVVFAKPGYIGETARVKYLKKGESFDLPMVMFRPAKISGTVAVRDVKVPAVNVNVSLGGRTSYAVQTFPDGTYVFDDVKPGSYRLQLGHPGFLPEKAELTVAEGETRKGVDFSIASRSPSLSVHAYRYTFVPGSDIQFNMRTFRMEKVGVAIYRVPMEVMAGGRADPLAMSPAAAGFREVKRWSEPVRNFRPYEWRYQDLSLNAPLSPGGYCVELSGPGGIVDRKFFSVTTLGVVMKRSRDSVFAYVTDLVKNRPVKGVRVMLFDSTPAKKEFEKSAAPYEPPLQLEKLPARALHRGVTDENGVYRHGISGGAHMTVLALGDDGSYAFCSTGSPLAFESQMNRFFIYTDRPVYRAGNTVYYKIIGKKRDAKGVPLARKRVHYNITSGADGRVIDAGEVTLDEWGTAHGKAVIGDAEALGQYSIRAGLDAKALFDTGRFYVEEYRKPEFKIDITPSKDYFVNGDTARFKVESRYFFGAPMANALVRYRFYETALRDRDTVYWWEQDEGVRSYGRIRLQGEKFADAGGIAVLDLDCGDLNHDREITLEATVVDKSNATITAKKTVRVGRGEFYIKLVPSRNFFDDASPKRVTVKTLTHAGAPVPRTVRLQLYRYIWRPLQMVYVHESRPLFQENVTTRADGTAVVDLPRVAAGGEFDLVATARDARGNDIQASRVIWIYRDDGADVASRFKNLELTVDKSALPGPGNLTCLVKSRFAGATVCLTVEGRGLFDHRVVTLKGNMATVTIPVKAEYGPNFYVHAVMQRNRALYTAHAESGIPAKDTALDISIRTDSGKYLPGGKASVLLTVKDKKGNPVRADVSLACVDESIFHVRPDHTPNILDYFYSRVSNWVLTSYSYPITLLAGAVKSVIRLVRERFEDTALWLPSVRTGADGTARVSIDLPHNLTTWRITARGHDMEGRVGQATMNFLVTQDLAARIGRPRFFSEGDKVSLIGIVTSNTEKDLPSVKDELSVDGTPVAPDEKIALSLPARGTARSYYPITVPENRESLELYYRVQAGKDAGDALKLRVPVESRGARYDLFASGDTSENKTVELAPLGGTDDFDFSPKLLVVTVDPGPVAKMLRAAEELAQYPYACIEQSISAALPAFVLRDLLRRRNLGQIADFKKLDERMQRALQKIHDEQNDDGTWGWFSGDRGNEYVTGHVLASLKQARLLGLAVNGETVERGIEAARRILDSNEADADLKAFMLAAAAEWGEWNAEASGFVARSKDPNPYRLANHVRALAIAGKLHGFGADARKKMGDELSTSLSILLRMQRKDGRGVFWAATEEQRYGWPGGDTEVSSHVLRAFLAAGHTSPVTGMLAASLMKRGTGNAWLSTKESAAVISSLCAWLDHSGASLEAKGRVRISLNGAPRGEIAYDISRRAHPADLSLSIPLGSAGGGKYAVTVEGDPGVTFGAALRGNLYFKKEGFLSFLKSEERGLRVLDNGISLSRDYSAVTRVRDINDAEYSVPRAFTGQTRLRVGDEIMVRLCFRARDDFEFLLLEDFLPSGFEVVKQDAYMGARPYARVERRDERMVFFFTAVAKGSVCEVAYTMRAELPGEFIARPARAECMYEPSVQGWSKPARFTVEK